MPALSERKIEIVRMLVEQAPDRVVGGLQAALAETTAESALAGVRRLVEAEARERRLRNTILLPLAPMCVGDGRDPHAVTFPARVLPLIWRGLGACEAALVDMARSDYLEHKPDQPAPDSFEALTDAAADAVAAREPAQFREAAELADAARPDGAATLASCLRIAPVVRRATLRLPEWLARFDDASAAAARLAFRDAVSISEDAGPLFFEMLSAQMAHPWMVLRVIGEVMDKPNERYLADSEMGGFGERVLAEVEENLTAIARLDVDGGPPAARAAGQLVELVTQQIAEIETCVDLSREHGWGLRLSKQKQGLASVVEGRMRDAEKFAKEALPSQPARLKRIRRVIPRLSSPPDPRMVGRAVTLLTFAHEIRSSANYGGFAAARSKLLEILGGYIDHHVEEILDLVKTGDAESEENAYAFLEICAQLNHLVQGEKAGDLVRRRAHAAQHPDAPPASEMLPRSA
jgi:hypothetical protein